MGNLATPASVQKLQTALHAKAKTEAEFRFYGGPLVFSAITYGSGRVHFPGVKGGDASKCLILRNSVILIECQDCGVILLSQEAPAVVLSTAADGRILSA